MGVGVIDIVELILWVIFVDFIFCGMIIASGMWFLCNKVFTATTWFEKKVKQIL